MEPTVVAIVAAAAANAAVLLGGLGLWLGHRTRRAERLERREQLERLERQQHLIAPLEVRLVELTRAVDVIAVEVERMAEVQRYLMLGGRTGAALPPLEPPPARPGPRSVTPI
jgi:hypothetical protein